MREKVDLLINAKWILPIVPERQLLTNCSVAVHDGKIIAIVPTSEASKRITANETVVLDRHLLMPGLVNGHGHWAMSLLRGYADDLALQDWLENHIWPAEAKFADSEFVRDGSQLAIAEMIASGSTCASDMYFFAEEAAAVAHETGFRAQICCPVVDFPTRWGDNADDYINKTIKLHDKYRNSDRIDIGFGPHAPYTVADEALKRIAILAEELQAPVQIHLHETANEIDNALAAFGMRPINRLQNLGVLSPLWQCIHLTQLIDEDITVLHDTGAHAIHCPQSNLKLGSGICPITKLIANNVNVAIGTDGAASNNSLDMFKELQLASLLAKGVTGNADALDAWQTLTIATLGGAKAMGVDDKIGSLEVGKFADMIALDFSGLASQPLHSPVSHAAYTNAGTCVSHSWVAGKLLLNDGKLTTINENEVTATAENWRKRFNQ